MPKDWTQYDVTEEKDWTQYDVSPIADEPINIQALPQGISPSLLRNFGYGMTFGASAPLEAAYEKVAKGTPYVDAYKAVQSALETSRMQQPKTALGLEVAGSAIPMFLAPEFFAGAKGMQFAQQVNAARQAMQGAPYLSRVAQMSKFAPQAAKIGAKQGAIIGGVQQAMGGPSSLFDTEYEGEQIPLAGVVRTVGDVAKGVLEGGVGGGLLGALSPGVSEAVGEPIKKAAKWGYQKLGPAVGVNRQVAEEFINHIEAYRGRPMTDQEIADFVGNAVNAESAAAGKLWNDAKASLDNTKEVMKPWQAALKLMDGMKRAGVMKVNPKTGSPESHLGEDVINTFRSQMRNIDNIAGQKGYLTEKDLRAVLDDLRPFTKYHLDLQNPDKARQVASAYKLGFGELNSDLQTANPKYAEITKPLGEKFGMLDDVSEALRLKYAGDPNGDRYEIGDATLRRIRNLRTNKKAGETIQGFSDQFLEGKDIIGASERLRNEGQLASKGLAPSLVIGGTTNPALGWLYAAGRPAWKQLGLMGATPRPSVMQKIINQVGMSPTLDPKYLGTPNMTAEEYRALIDAQAKEARRIWEESNQQAIEPQPSGE